MNLQDQIAAKMLKKLVRASKKYARTTDVQLSYSISDFITEEEFNQIAAIQEQDRKFINELELLY